MIRYIYKIQASGGENQGPQLVFSWEEHFVLASVCEGTRNLQHLENKWKSRQDEELGHWKSSWEEGLPGFQSIWQLPKWGC